MAFRIPDGVHETTETSGTGAITMLGAVSGAQPASSQLANGDTTIYAIWDDTDIEVGLTTYDNSSGEQLLRDQGVRNSTAGGAKVDWPVGGTRNVVLGIDGLALSSLLNPAAAAGFVIRTAANLYTGVDERGINGGFRPRADDPPSMNVIIGAGRVFRGPILGGVISDDPEVAVALSGADPTDPRIDLVVISRANGSSTSQVVAGTPDPSPQPGAVPADFLPVAQVVVGAGVSEITDTDITDVRCLHALGLGDAAFRSVGAATSSALIDRATGDARYVLQ